jgi:hypothetical protein
MRKTVLVLGALALSVGMTASPAWSAEGGTERPVKGTSFTLSGVTGQGSGSTIGAHTGRSDLQLQGSGHRLPRGQHQLLAPTQFRSPADAAVARHPPTRRGAGGVLVNTHDLWAGGLPALSW